MKLHDVRVVGFEGANMIFTVDGRRYSVHLPSVSPRLAQCNEAAARLLEIAPSGYGIHWPAADEDLTIEGLIRSATPSAPNEQEAGLMLNEEPPKS